MFAHNQWYGAVWSQDLESAPVARRILGRAIVLFRTGDGEVAVLEDLCPHRFVPLSLGKVVDGQRLRCIYHGLEFDRSGACVHNPHTNGRIPPAAKVKRFSAVERHGMVWVWLGNKPADPALISDYSVLDEADPKLVSPREWLEVKANYTIVVDNLLDLSHACTLHEGILGNAEMTDAKIEVEHSGTDLIVRRLMTDVPVPLLFDLLYKGDQGQVDSWADIRLMGISNLLNHTGATEPGMGRAGGTGMKGAHILTPIDETTTLYHFCAVRENPPARTQEDDIAIRAHLTALRNEAFSKQDAVVMEAQQAALADPNVDTSRPAMFDIDVGASHYARRVKDMLAADAIG